MKPKTKPPAVRKATLQLQTKRLWAGITHEDGETAYIIFFRKPPTRVRVKPEDLPRELGERPVGTLVRRLGGYYLFESHPSGDEGWEASERRIKRNIRIGEMKLQQFEKAFNVDMTKELLDSPDVGDGRIARLFEIELTASFLPDGRLRTDGEF